MRVIAESMARLALSLSRFRVFRCALQRQINRTTATESKTNRPKFTAKVTVREMPRYSSFVASGTTAVALSEAVGDMTGASLIADDDRKR